MRNPLVAAILASLLFAAPAEAQSLEQKLFGGIFGPPTPPQLPSGPFPLASCNDDPPGSPARQICENQVRLYNQERGAQDYGRGLGAYRAHDLSTALTLFTRAAQEGNAKAQFALGGMYDEGVGVNQDYRQAVAWWQQSANQGYANAEFYLGTMYENGQGVPADKAEAIVWYRKAAAQGYTRAMNAIASLGSQALTPPLRQAEEKFHQLTSVRVALASGAKISFSGKNFAIGQVIGYGKPRGGMVNFNPPPPETDFYTICFGGPTNPENLEHRYSGRDCGQHDALMIDVVTTMLTTPGYGTNSAITQRFNVSILNQLNASGRLDFSLYGKIDQWAQQTLSQENQSQQTAELNAENADFNACIDILVHNGDLQKCFSKEPVPNSPFPYGELLQYDLCSIAATDVGGDNPPTPIFFRGTIACAVDTRTGLVYRLNRDQSGMLNNYAVASISLPLATYEITARAKMQTKERQLQNYTAPKL